MLSRRRVLLLALERRVNFDLEQLRAVSTGYAQFQSHICHNVRRHGVSEPGSGAHRLCNRDLCCAGRPMPPAADAEARELAFCCDAKQPCTRPFVARQLSTAPADLPQCFEYRRVKELELWEVWRT